MRQGNSNIPMSHFGRKIKIYLFIIYFIAKDFEIKAHEFVISESINQGRFWIIQIISLRKFSCNKFLRMRDTKSCFVVSTLLILTPSTISRSVASVCKNKISGQVDRDVTSWLRLIRKYITDRDSFYQSFGLRNWDRL